MVVKTRDSEVGKVNGIVVDQEMMNIPHLLLRKGYLWVAKDVCVPIAVIESVSGDEAHLKID